MHALWETSKNQLQLICQIFNKYLEEIKFCNNFLNLSKFVKKKMFSFIKIEHPTGKAASSKYSSFELMTLSDSFEYAKQPGKVRFQK